MKKLVNWLKREPKKYFFAGLAFAATFAIAMIILGFIPLTRRYANGAPLATWESVKSWFQGRVSGFSGSRTTAVA